jgi:hypothetical protein
MDTVGFYTESRVVHGYNSLPPGYAFAFVPHDTKVFQLDDSTATSPQIYTSSNTIKVALALCQSTYASFTVYQSRGDQINRFGYAAFALAVVPYAVMSIVSLLGNLMTADYPMLYLVASEVMEEAKLRGGQFPCVVGKIVSDHILSSNEDSAEISGSFDDMDDGNGVLLLSGKSFNLWLWCDITQFFGADKEGAFEFVSPPRRHSHLLFVPACPKFQRHDDSYDALSFFYAIFGRTATPRTSYTRYGPTIRSNHTH